MASGTNPSFPYSLLTVDLEHYSQLPAWRQAEVRADLSRILDSAAMAAHLDRSAWAIQDTGDGELTLIPATVPKASLVADLVREVVTELGRYNRTHNQHGRIRLRAALHHGEARIDGDGFAGEAPIVACRLVDSEELKAALRAEPDADLVLILSDQMFQDTVAQGERGLDRRRYTRVEITQPKFEGVAWVTVPGFDPPDLPGARRAAASDPPRPDGQAGVNQVLHDQARAIGTVDRSVVSMGDGPAIGTVSADRVTVHGAPGQRRVRNGAGRPDPE